MSRKFSSVLEKTPGHWQLIDRIYATGESPEEWPVLLDSLFTSFGMHDLHEMPDAGTVQASLQTILPHFERALALNQSIDNADSHTMDGVYADFPYPLVVVNGKLEIVCRHATGTQMFPPQSGIRVDTKTISVSISAVAAKLREMLDDASDKPNGQSGILLHREETSDKSLIALSLQSLSGHRMVALAWLDPIYRSRLSADHFRQLYKLTKAESSVLDSVLRGEQTDQAAKRLSVTSATIRAHLKSIFKKTATRRKAELILTVMCGPAFLNRYVATPTGMFTDTDAAKQRRNQSIILNDGRRLGFAEYGSPQGTPVLLVHNLIGSRKQIPTGEENLEAQNLRLIIPDRPGVGLSDAPEQQSMRLWSQDMVELTDHLTLPRFHLIGSSLGAVYGLALAHYVPDRIVKFAMVSCLPEVVNRKIARELPPSTRRLLTLVRYAPVTVDFILKMIARRGSEAFMDRLVCDLPDIDQQLYRDPAFHRMMAYAISETLRQGTSALLNDIKTMASPWEFRPESIGVPVDCWHGQDDAMAPYHLMQNVSAKLRNCRINILKEETHWLLFRQWNAIVEMLINEP